MPDHGHRSRETLLLVQQEDLLLAYHNRRHVLQTIFSLLEMPPEIDRASQAAGTAISVKT